MPAMTIDQVASRQFHAVSSLSGDGPRRRSDRGAWPKTRSTGEMLQMGIDGGVGQIGDEVALPVPLQPLRIARIEQALQRRIRHRAAPVDQRRRQRLADSVDRRLAASARCSSDEQRARSSCPRCSSGKRRRRRHGLQAEEDAEILRRIRQEVAVPAHHLPRRRHVLDDRAAIDVLTGWVRNRNSSRRRNCRRRRAAPRTDPRSPSRWRSRDYRRPARRRPRSGCRRQAVLSAEIAVPAAKREARNAGRRDDPDGTAWPNAWVA